jgi:hypothetical protein
VTDDRTVVGICLLDIADIRPTGLPAPAGIRIQTPVHRIAVDWDGEDGRPVSGVFVTVRHTSARLAAFAAVRLFPGVHERAEVFLDEDDRRIEWSVQPHDPNSAFGVRIAATFGSAAPAEAPESVGRTCLGATVGVSPDRRGRLEAAHMETTHQRAITLDLDALNSRFLDGFSTATPGPSYLMRDVEVVWRPVAAPSGGPASEDCGVAA